MASGVYSLLYSDEKSQINCLALDEKNNKLWFSNSSDSSIKYIDLSKR
jgi:hypothetical protein